MSRDRFAALELVAAVGLRAVVVGEVAGAVHGWPLILSYEGTLDLVMHPEGSSTGYGDGPRRVGGTRSCPSA